MMRLSPRQARAYHVQIDRMHAVDLIDLFEVTAAPHRTPSDQRNLLDSLQRRAAAEQTVVTVANNQQLAEFMRKVT